MFWVFFVPINVNRFPQMMFFCLADGSNQMMSQQVKTGVLNMDLAIVASAPDLPKASTIVEGDLNRVSPICQPERKSSRCVQKFANDNNLGLFSEQCP